MVATSSFNTHSRVCLSIGLYLLFIFSVTLDTHAQTATYHLHREASTTANLFQLKTGAPDAASLAVQTANLKNKTVGEYLIKAFDTQSGVPGATGTITAGSTVTFTLWLKRTGSGGTMLPRAKLNLNSATGTTISVVTGTAALTTTLTKYTLSGTVPANVNMTSSDRLYLWVGINLTASPNANSVAELDVEGALNGNYDSNVTVPLPSPPPPSISSLTPNSGTIGTSVSVAGANFGATQGTSTITFNGTTATPASWSATSISVPVPSGATSGPVVVTVNGQASNGASFTVTPRIDNLSPTSGVVGTAVTITGTTLGATQGTSTVTFNGTVASPTSWSATSIVAPVPAGSTTGSVVVTVGGQASNGVTFTVTTATGTIAGTITRTSDGAAINGALVEALQGGVVKASTTSAANGSYTLANVQVGTYDVRASASGYQTSIQDGVVVTANTTTTVNPSLTPVAAGEIEYVYDELGRLVGVITPTERATYTYDAVGNLLSISRGSSSQVSIIEFTPNNGAVGTTVTIYGTAFSTTPSQNTVTFNGVAATVTSATTTKIVTEVPVGATTGPIGVTTPAGTTTSSTPFIVGNPTGPTITGFTPTLGAAGTGVTITGTNFDPSFHVNKVQFSQTFATVTASTSTTITTIVPAAAGSGRITVTTPEGSAVSSAYFFIPPSPHTVAEVEVMSQMAIGQSQVVSLTTANKIAIIVFDGVAGQWVSLGMTDTTISASGCCASSTVAIYKPDGTALLAPFAFFSVGGGTPSVQLPTTGTYAIVVKPHTNLVGSVTLHLSEDLSPPISINGPPVILTNRPGQNGRLRFSGNAGQWVSLAATDTTIGAPNCCLTSTVAILKPDGTTLQEPLQFFSTGTATPSLQLPVTGTYSIVVDPYNAVAGNVTITLSEDLSPPISINGPPVILTNRPGQNARLFFSGNAGQWVSLGASDTTIGAPACCTTSTMAIYKADGTTLVAPLGFFGFTAGNGTPSVQLPATGTYTIVIDPYNTVAGNVTLTLSEDLSPPISINGPPVTLTNRAGQNARLSFNGNAGQWISLGITDSTIGAPACCNTSTVAILKPDGTALLSPLGFFGFNPITTTQSLQLPASGTYTLVVDPYNAVAGNVTITLSEDVSPAISINGPSAVLEFTRVGQNSRVLFSGNAGQWVSLGMTDTTISAVGCCATSTVAINKPDGTTLLAPFAFFQSGGGTPSVQLPVTGTYSIIVEPYNNMLGNVTLTLSEDLSPPTSINGPPVTLTNRAGQNGRLLFSGNAGQWVSLAVTDTTIGAPNCCLTSTVAILKPDGTTLQEPLQFYSTGTATPSLQLPVTGTYSIIVDPYNAVTGNVTITLSEDLSASISINGPPVILTNRPGQNERLFFSGTAGQWVSLGASDTTIGAPACCTTSTMAIYKPDGTTLVAPLGFFGFQPGGGTPSAQLPVTGTYTIIIDPYNTVAGNVTLTLSEDLSPPISINGPPVTLTNRPGQNARLSFNGNAGQWISLGITDSTIGAPACCNTSTVAILKPDGTALLSPLGFFGFNPITTTQSLQLPASGTYTLVVDPYNAVAGNVTITLSEDLSPPISINGPPAVLDFNRVGRNSRVYFSGNAGQWVSLGMTDTTISAVGCCATSTVAIFNPDGTTLLGTFGFFQRGGGTPSLQLPVTGTYMIIVEPYNNMLGSVTLTLSEELSPPISINAPPVVLTNRPGQNTRMFFSGSAGQQVTLGVNPTTIGPPNCCNTSRVTIVNPDGSFLLEQMHIFDYGAASPALQLPATGTYTILVDPYDAVAGDAAIVLSEELQFQISINAPPLSYNFNRVAQNASYSFFGSGGSLATVRLSGDIPGLSVKLIRPDGIVLAQTTANGSNFNLATQTLPMSGTYRIFIDPSGTNLGNLNVSVTTP